MTGLFTELAIVMILALIISFIFSKIKQPPIVGYIVTGILAGPLFLDILSKAEGYQAFSHIGVAFLLFIVGLHLNLKLIKEIGKIALISGFIQIILTGLFGFLISLIFKFSYFTSFLIGIAVAFSSTIVIVKLLTDKKDTEKVYAKLSMGILIVQDIVAVLMLIVVASIAGTNGDNSIGFTVIKTFGLGILGFIGVWLFSKYVLEKLLDSIAKSQEILFTFIIAWCLGIAVFFTLFGFSLEIGALIAGVLLASSPYSHEISSRVKPLRDFFIILFFILLGSQMIPVTEISGILSYNDLGFIEIISTFFQNTIIKFGYIGEVFSSTIIPAVVLSLFVLIIKPLIIFFIFNVLKFHTRINFYTSITLGQISEFSLIMFMSAKTLGLIGSEEVSLITLVAIFTILFSTYFQTHTEKYYQKIKKILKKIEMFKPKKNNEESIVEDLDVIIFGYDRIGFTLLKTIVNLEKKFVIVDINPTIIKKLKASNMNCVYGDASDNDFIEEFNLEKTEMFISTIPELEISIGLLKQLKRRNKSAITIFTAHHIDDALELYKFGADYVILPHFLGGNYIAEMIEKSNGKLDHFLKKKIDHISELKERKIHGFEHPKHFK